MNNGKNDKMPALTPGQERQIEAHIRKYIGRWLKALSILNFAGIIGVFLFIYVQAPRWVTESLVQKKESLEKIQGEIDKMNRDIGSISSSAKRWEKDLSEIKDKETIELVAQAARNIHDVERLEDFIKKLDDLNNRIDEIYSKPIIPYGKTETKPINEGIKNGSNINLNCEEGYVVTGIGINESQKPYITKIHFKKLMIGK